MFDLFKKKPKKRRVVDLYYILSRAMFYDIDKKKLVSDNEAKDIFSRRNGLREIGSMSSGEGVKADLFNDGALKTISGTIYEL